MPVIRVTRIKQPVLSIKRIDVVIDGKVVGKIWGGGTMDFTVTPGRHTVNTRFELFTKSPMVEVDVGDELVHLEASVEQINNLGSVRLYLKHVQ